MLPYFETHGDRGPYLLMVHGFLLSRAQWLDNLEALTEYCRPVVVELYGHGRSPAPKDPGHYQPAAYLAAFEEIRHIVGTRQWLTLGYSLGAGLALAYNLTHPNRVIASAFTNSTSALADNQVAPAYPANEKELLARFEKNGASEIDKIPVHPKYAKQLPPHLKKSLLQDCELLDPTGVANSIVYTSRSASIRTLADKNQTPTLLLCGEREKRFKPYRDFAEAHMRALTIVDLPAGHGVNMECPALFNEALMRHYHQHIKRQTS